MLQTAMLFGILAGIFLVIGFVLGGVIGMTIALILAVAINGISFWYSDKIVLKMYRARPVDSVNLDRMVSILSREAKIPKPKLYIISNYVPNAFATGRDPSHSSIAITEGLLELDDDEINGVISHEIAHIMNKDVMVSMMAATIAGAIAYLAQIGYWSLFIGREDQSEGSVFGMILVLIFAPLAALLIRMAISRSNEFRADRTGALLTKDPKGLSNALRKISRFASEHPIKTGSATTSHMWIVNPFRNDFFSRLFMTHPPVQNRIERLEEMIN